MPFRLFQISRENFLRSHSISTLKKQFTICLRWMLSQLYQTESYFSWRPLRVLGRCFFLFFSNLCSDRLFSLHFEIFPQLGFSPNCRFENWIDDIHLLFLNCSNSTVRYENDNSVKKSFLWTNKFVLVVMEFEKHKENRAYFLKFWSAVWWEWNGSVII